MEVPIKIWNYLFEIFETVLSRSRMSSIGPREIHLLDRFVLICTHTVLSKWAMGTFPLIRLKCSNQILNALRCFLTTSLFVFYWQHHGLLYWENPFHRLSFGLTSIFIQIHSLFSKYRRFHSCEVWGVRKT